MSVIKYGKVELMKITIDDKQFILEDVIVNKQEYDFGVGFSIYTKKGCIMITYYEDDGKVIILDEDNNIHDMSSVEFSFKIKIGG